MAKTNPVPETVSLVQGQPVVYGDLVLVLEHVGNLHHGRQRSGTARLLIGPPAAFAKTSSDAPPPPGATSDEAGERLPTDLDGADVHAKLRDED